MQTQRIRSTKPNGYGWAEGCIKGIRFQAKVYDSPSRRGINNGRVETLAAWLQAKGSSNGLFASFNRVWKKAPANDEQILFLGTLVNHLEALPPSEHWS